MLQIEAIAQGSTVSNFLLAPTYNWLPWAMGKALVSSPGGGDYGDDGCVLVVLVVVMMVL